MSRRHPQHVRLRSAVLMGTPTQSISSGVCAQKCFGPSAGPRVVGGVGLRDTDRDIFAQTAVPVQSADVNKADLVSEFDFGKISIHRIAFLNDPMAPARREAKDRLKQRHFGTGRATQHRDEAALDIKRAETVVDRRTIIPSVGGNTRSNNTKKSLPCWQ